MKKHFPKWLLAAVLLSFGCLINAADNKARVYRFRDFRGMWVGPQETLIFTNCGPITIADDTTATPYPSTIIVENVSRPVSHIAVVISGLSHRFPDDIDMLLVNPQGTNIVLMSDCGGGSANALTNVTITFTDTATIDLPDATRITNGTYKPTNYGAGDPFTLPAPSSSLTTTFADFIGRDANGGWSLYVMDDQGGDSGSISNCWSITFSY